MTDDTPTWAYRTVSLLPLERRRLPDDPDLAPDAAIVGTFLDGRLIARAVAESGWTPEQDEGLLDVPRYIQYTADEVEGGTIRAELYAMIPARDLPREPWQPEPDDDVPEEAFLLGVVVRLPQDRAQRDFAAECFDHFMAILQLGAESVVDRLLKSL